MNQAIREAVLHLDPLKTTVLTELIRLDGTRHVKTISSDDLAREMSKQIRSAPLQSGLLPENVIALTAHKEHWSVTLSSLSDCDTVYYHDTAFVDFPLPRILLKCDITREGRVKNFKLAVTEAGALLPDAKLYVCPFPNVNGFYLCVGNNVFDGYDSIWKMRGLVHRVLSIPFSDDYYSPERTKLNLSARDLFCHLQDKEPSYYYSNVLIPNGKKLSDFLQEGM